jgi:hypothetical protein
MKYHPTICGMCKTYTELACHGESLIPEVVVVDDIAPTNDKVDVIEYVMDEGTEDSGGVSDDFDYLFEEV